MCYIKAREINKMMMVIVQYTRHSLNQVWRSAAIAHTSALCSAALLNKQPPHALYEIYIEKMFAKFEEKLTHIESIEYALDNLP